ncbi:MAG: CocE/NonD family hydrolase [Rhizomicrobium sp.]
MTAKRRRRVIALSICAALVVLGYVTWAPLANWLMDAAIHRVMADRFADMPPETTEAQPAQTVQVRMRDGVRLETHIYLPQGRGPWPVILVRDPYELTKFLSCRIFVHYGYACVHQDVRGRFGSGGAWYPLLNERNDGLDTIDWILTQSWQNRKLALWGESYLGLVQWAMADKLRPEVKTFVAGVSHGDMYQMIYHNGMFVQGIVGLWSAGLSQPLWKSFTAQDHWKDRIAGKIPAVAVDPDDFRASWASYHDYLLHPEKGDAYWHSPTYDAIRESYKGVHVPVLMFGRSYDFFLPGMLDTFRRLPTRAQSVLYLGPGEHGGAPGDLKVDHPNRRYFADIIAWFDHFLKDKPLPASLAPGYHVYVNGADRWQHYADWPGATQPRTLYLDKIAASHGCERGALSARPPAASASAAYRYDPRNPVPTRGTSYSLSTSLVPSAVAEQKNDLCGRPDVLSFASAVFPTAQLISGGMQVKLLVASDAPDTAFTVKLSEHFADGHVFNIRDDISTLGLRNGAVRRLVYRPGDKVEVDFALTPIAWQMHAGSRLRLDVSSSNFPVFNAHPNRAGLWSTAASPVVARQTLYGGALEIPFAK